MCHVASGDQRREQFTPGGKVTFYLLTPPLFNLVFRVFIHRVPRLALPGLEEESTGETRWPACWLAVGEGLFIKWMAVYRAELLQGAFISSLLKATFCRYLSGEKRFLFLKIPA